MTSSRYLWGSFHECAAAVVKSWQLNEYPHLWSWTSWSVGQVLQAKLRRQCMRGPKVWTKQGDVKEPLIFWLLLTTPLSPPCLQPPSSLSVSGGRWLVLSSPSSSVSSLASPRRSASLSHSSSSSWSTSPTWPQSSSHCPPSCRKSPVKPFS